MGGGRKFLQYTQPQEQYGERHLYVCYGLFSAGHHASWLVSPTLSRWRQVRTGTLPLETGEVLAILRWPQFSPSADVISIQKGLIWLLLTTIAELPPLVCLAGFLRHHLANYSFSSQVFICLDLNGTSFPPNSERKNVDSSACQIQGRLIWYVFVCYDCYERWNKQGFYACLQS